MVFKVRALLWNEFWQTFGELWQNFVGIALWQVNSGYFGGLWHERLAHFSPNSPNMHTFPCHKRAPTLNTQQIYWEKLNRGVSKPGCFPLFSGKVQIVSRTLSGLSLVGALNRPRKRKRTNRENPWTIPEQIGKIPEKSGKSQKGQKRTKKEGQVQIGKPPRLKPPRSAALEIYDMLRTWLATKVAVDALLLGEDTLGSSLEKLGMIELVQAVLRDAKQLLCCSVGWEQLALVKICKSLGHLQNRKTPKSRKLEKNRQKCSKILFVFVYFWSSFPNFCLFFSYFLDFGVFLFCRWPRLLQVKITICLETRLTSQMDFEAQSPQNCCGDCWGDCREKSGCWEECRE